jgi:large subunit ribosomal protein L17
VFGYLQSKEAVTELFREVATKIAQRPGGYTRILKTGMRKGDNADMCFIELVDYNENLLAEKQEKKAKTTRRSRTTTKKTTDKAEVAEPKEKAPKKKAAKAEVVDKVEEPTTDQPAEEKNEEAAEGETKE